MNAKTIHVTTAVLDEILEERVRQDAKFGPQNHPDGTGEAWPDLVRPAFGWDADPARHAARLARQGCQRDAKKGKTTWVGIALEEVAEAFAETDPVKLRAELLQVAAVAVNWIEAIDRRTAAPAVALSAAEPVRECVSCDNPATDGCQCGGEFCDDCECDCEDWHRVVADRVARAEATAAEMDRHALEPHPPATAVQASAEERAGS